jgi:uncharacterized protein (DUF736 family)
MKKSALNIGRFTAAEIGFMGKLDTLTAKAPLTFEGHDEKEKDSHPLKRAKARGHRCETTS